MNDVDHARRLGQHLRIAEARAAGTFPRVVCLCGSMRFNDEFARQLFDRTLGGEIVLTVGCNTKDGAGVNLVVEDKVALDVLHQRKIDLADYVFVINVGGYIGESTKNEIGYAVANRVPIDYLEPIGAQP